MVPNPTRASTSSARNGPRAANILPQGEGDRAQRGGGAVRLNTMPGSQSRFRPTTPQKKPPRKGTASFVGATRVGGWGRRAAPAIQGEAGTRPCRPVRP